ncbi:GPW/gp25 family protein [Cellulophaga sp. 20_2_10]|uniref:GPW/gp25 family protein n=1 Tax=Cellulophaga sp. 20_2_10 TaxID=2942476 RepID=UPI00201AFA18|nr:GPW/gp25 family protein [Cellulophaga sp. 20_2_10]MCL5244946.1 GPW/gp25 family protein [Cellulophaga sp. 20_2_10]
MNYLKLPIDFSEILTNKSADRCSKVESIAQHIMMMITSRYGEVVGRDDFGSQIWELEFSQLVRIKDWEERVENSLTEAIKKYEFRLKDIKVSVVLSEVDDNLTSPENTQIRRKSQISVKAKLLENDMDFNFNTLIYISPLSQ